MEISNDDYFKNVTKNYGCGKLPWTTSDHNNFEHIK